MDMGKKRGKGYHFGVWPLLAALTVFIVIPVLTVLSLPYIITMVDIPEITVDLTANLPAKVSAVFTNHTATAKIKVKSGPGDDLIIDGKGRILDLPYTFTAITKYSLTGSAEADFRLALDGTGWIVDGKAAATLSTWNFKAHLPSVSFSETDRLLARALAAYLPQNISNVVFSGSVNLDVTAEKTKKVPVPVWSAKGRVNGLDAECMIREAPLSIRGLSVGFGADGIADRTTIRPMFPRIDYAEYNGISITDFTASIRMTESALLVTEAGAGFCGGEVKLYSLFLDPARLTTGFTLFLDDIDSNQVINHLKGFHGKATGRLHGKIPVFLKDGRELRLRNSYLYSVPGEVGTLELTEAEPIIDNLAMAGVDEATTANLAKALANLKYTALKFDLKREDDGDLALVISVDGTATRGKTTVPVSISAALHGDLEQLINTGLRIKLRSKSEEP